MRRRDFITLLGGAASSMTFPLSAGAQQSGKSYRIGYLALLPGEDATLGKVVLQRLDELGYSQGQNMTFDYRSAEGRAERLPQLATELVEAKPDVLIAGFGTLAAQAAKTATTSIPIVFTSVGDPIGAGLVASLNRPDTNVTGVTSQASDIVGKRLQILEELVPGVEVVAVVLNPETPFSVLLALQQLRTAAGTGHVRLSVIESRTTDQMTAGIGAARQAGADGLLTLDDPLLLGLRRQIVELTAKIRLPAIYGSRDFAEVGGLVSYGVDRQQPNRRAAEYIDKILKGAKPAELPVEQPTKFELVIHRRTAKALGLVIPPTLLALADEVIE
jgi:putative tryptophan/tyrosine transport system substrate-binding protein